MELLNRISEGLQNGLDDSVVELTPGYSTMACLRE